MKNRKYCKFLSLISIIRKLGEDKKQFCTLIQCLDENSIKFLCESVKNGISKHQFERLSSKKRRHLLSLISPHKSLLRRICRKSKTYKINKKKLLQKGAGFFIPLLSTLIPLVSCLIAK